MKLFVAGIPYDMDDVDVKEMFELYGEVKSAKVVMDKETGKSKGFGFVEYVDAAEAKQAIQLLNGVGFRGGKKMSVMEAEQPGTRPARSDNFNRNDNRGNNRYNGGGSGDYKKRY